MLQVDIEKNVPIPKERSCQMAGSKRRDLLLSMKRGDSFVIPDHIRRRDIMGVAYQLKQKGLGVWTSRKTKDGQVRVWRVNEGWNNVE